MGIKSRSIIDAPIADVGTAERVLVVDDSKSQRRILTVYLSRWGYEVLQAGTGAEALEICAQQEIDLIVSDWMMPGMSGLELCQKYRALKRDRYG